MSNEKKGTQKPARVYIKLTQFFSPNVVSVIIAILSGTAINLFTNENSNSRYGVPIVCLTIATTFLVLFWTVVENFHESYAEKQLDRTKRLEIKELVDNTADQPTIFVPRSDMELWREVIIADRGRYLTILFLSALFITISIGSIVSTNAALVEEAGQEKERLNSTLELISANLESTRERILVIESDIKKQGERMR